MTAVLWFLLTVIGPLLLLGALCWGFWCDRNANGDGTRERPDEGARQLRQRIASNSRYRD